MNRSIWLLAALLALICLVSSVESRTTSYWDSVSAVLSGENFYDLLEITNQAEPTQIKKAYRKLSKQ